MADLYRAVVLRVSNIDENLPVVVLGRDLTNQHGIELWEWTSVTEVCWIVQTSLVQKATDILWEHHDLAYKYLGPTEFTWAFEPLTEQPVISLQTTNFATEGGFEFGCAIEWIRHTGKRPKARYISWPHHWKSGRHLQMKANVVRLPRTHSRAVEEEVDAAKAVCGFWGFGEPRFLHGRAVVADRGLEDIGLREGRVPQEPAHGKHPRWPALVRYSHMSYEEYIQKRLKALKNVYGQRGW